MASPAKIAAKYLRANSNKYEFSLRVVGVPKPSIDGIGGTHLTINEINFVKEAGAFDNYNSTALKNGGFFPSGDVKVRKIGEYDYMVSGVYYSPLQSRISMALVGDFLGGWVQALSELNSPQSVVVTHLKKQ